MTGGFDLGTVHTVTPSFRAARRVTFAGNPLSRWPRDRGEAKPSVAPRRSERGGGRVEVPRPPRPATPAAELQVLPRDGREERLV